MYTASALIASTMKGNLPVFRECTSVVVSQRLQHTAGGARPSPGNSPFGTSDIPLLFLLGWRTYPQSWRSGFGQALPDDRRAPEGLGA
jgi:hypothetical protein